MRLIVALFILLFTSTAFAFDINVVADFIIENNPEIDEVLKYERNMLKNVKIDAKASVYRQDITRDEKQQQILFNSGYLLESTATGKRFEIVMTIPLLDLREQTERKMKHAAFLINKRAEVVKIAAKLKSLVDLSSYLDATLKNEKNELDWLKKRVDVGVEYQKDLNAATHKYNHNLYKYYETLASANELTETLASMVYDYQRARLRELIGLKYIAP